MYNYIYTYISKNIWILICAHGWLYSFMWVSVLASTYIEAFMHTWAHTYFKKMVCTYRMKIEWRLSFWNVKMETQCFVTLLWIWLTDWLMILFMQKLLWQHLTIFQWMPSQLCCACALVWVSLGFESGTQVASKSFGWRSLIMMIVDCNIFKNHGTFFHFLLSVGCDNLSHPMTVAWYLTSNTLFLF